MVMVMDGYLSCVNSRLHLLKGTVHKSVNIQLYDLGNSPLCFKAGVREFIYMVHIWQGIYIIQISVLFGYLQ